MHYFEALVLGLIQGVTEFLPISSSGHLVLAQNLLGIKEPQLLFDTMVHAATLSVILVALKSEVIKCVQAVGYLPKIWCNKSHDLEKRKTARLLWLILLASIPTGMIGFFLKDIFEHMFGSITSVGTAFIITGSLLWVTKKFRAEQWDYLTYPWWAAFIVGIAQGIAITPGISRSGSTISILLLLGMQKELAGRFSFLMAIPAIAAATLLQVFDSTSDVKLGILGVGFLGAFISGYLALDWLLKIVKHGTIWKFAPYCWILGIITIILSITR